jgi:hypothetical protein
MALIGGNVLYLFIDDGGNRAALWESGRPLSHHTQRRRARTRRARGARPKAARRRSGEQVWLPRHPPGELCAAAHAGQAPPACSPPAIMRPCRRDARCRRRRPSAHGDARASHPLPSPRDTLLPARPPRPPRETAREPPCSIAGTPPSLHPQVGYI